MIHLPRKSSLRNFVPSTRLCQFFYSFLTISSVGRNGHISGLAGQKEKCEWEDSKLFPKLLREQTTTGSVLAQTQPWQIPLSPLELVETTGNLILPVTGNVECPVVAWQCPRPCRRSCST